MRRMRQGVSSRIVAGGGRGSSVGRSGMRQLAGGLGVVRRRRRRRRGWEGVMAVVVVGRRIDRIQTGPFLGGRVKISHA